MIVCETDFWIPKIPTFNTNLNDKILQFKYKIVKLFLYYIINTSLQLSDDVLQIFMNHMYNYFTRKEHDKHEPDDNLLYNMIIYNIFINKLAFKCVNKNFNSQNWDTIFKITLNNDLHIIDEMLTSDNILKQEGEESEDDDEFTESASEEDDEDSEVKEDEDTNSLEEEDKNVDEEEKFELSEKVVRVVNYLLNNKNMKNVSDLKFKIMIKFGALKRSYRAGNKESGSELKFMDAVPNVSKQYLKSLVLFINNLVIHINKSSKLKENKQVQGKLNEINQVVKTLNNKVLNKYYYNKLNIHVVNGKNKLNRIKTLESKIYSLTLNSHEPNHYNCIINYQFEIVNYDINHELTKILIINECYNSFRY
ncbi:uncharacterized protein TA02840 [Theileria annulata]|uniref:Uncharacterized protein n=1 Tax=Theileria annulata TaxID=5874 RepID=Q4UHK6_THEAN|nr:uncharacterized protein TA02840 [Theileria annulata]CAI73433.1 hypothetical protein TA02840 [Theileria annulata]|eukprot:XP_954110.1 hypothetical protein TA02840 [Theileria annulata]